MSFIFFDFHVFKVKESACNQMEATASSLGRGIKKSIKGYTKDASRFAHSLSEFVDCEDLLKSIHKVAHPEQHAQRRSSIVHKPIGEQLGNVR